MVQIIGFPGKYIQGSGELRNLKQHVSWMGDRFLIIISKRGLGELEEQIRSGFNQDAKLVFTQFSGNCTKKTVQEIMDIARKEKCQAVIGIGGGKLIDTAKAVGYFLNLPTVIVPTIAASDAPTSALSVFYHEDDTLDEELHYNNNPDIILVDTEVIAKAPTRFLVAGMGDALSTYLGARVSYQGYIDNEWKSKPTELSMAIARLSYDLLLKHGLQAKIACDNNVVTKDFNKIVEANTLLSGLGCESIVGASDHSFYYGFCALTTREKDMLHGEYVTFSTLCMLVMEGAPAEELDEVYRFCLSVGLPVCLADIKLDNLTQEEFAVIARVALEQPPTHNHPFEVTQEEIIAAIKTADEIGRLYKQGKHINL